MPAICLRASSMRRCSASGRTPVQMTNVRLCRRHSKSARRQSTTCGWGERRYMASMSGFTGLRSSMFSISGSRLVLGGPCHVGHGTILATWRLRMSSWLSEVSIILRAAWSTTRTFHWRHATASERRSLSEHGRGEGPHVVRDGPVNGVDDRCAQQQQLAMLRAALGRQ